jgi:hypothetical protein
LGKIEVVMPTMGEVMRLRKDTYVALVCGQTSWMGLETPMDLSEVTAYQHRPTLTNESTKERANRIAGQDQPYQSGSKKVKEFVKAVYKHLKNYAKDTIAYVKDTTDEKGINKCELDSARFTTKKTENMLANHFQLYNSHDKKNDKEAVETLLVSVSDMLREELKSRTVEGEDQAFASYFPEFMKNER